MRESTFESDTCVKDLVNVASGGSDGNPAVYCFPDAGEYGVFVAPLFQDKTPCEGKPDTYALTLNGLECGTCFIEHDSPGCSDQKCRKTVCKYDDSCCKDAWDETCVEKAKLWCDCSKPDKPDKPDSGSSTRSSGKGKGSQPSDDGKGQSSRSMKKSSYSSPDSGKGKGSYPSDDSDDSGKGKGYSPPSTKPSKRSKRMKGMKGMRMKGMKGGSKPTKSSKSKSTKSSKGRKRSKRSKSHWRDW